jgi:hypothetical protein
MITIHLPRYNPLLTNSFIGRSVRMSEPMETEQPTVRFTSEVEQIEPEQEPEPSLEHVETLTSHHQEREDLSPEAKQELRSLAVTMQVCCSLMPFMFCFADITFPRKRDYRTSAMSRSHCLYHEYVQPSRPFVSQV